MSTFKYFNIKHTIYTWLAMTINIISVALIYTILHELRVPEYINISIISITALLFVLIWLLIRYKLLPPLNQIALPIRRYKLLPLLNQIALPNRENVLLTLNILTTIIRIIWYILVLGILYVWIVSFSSGLVGNLLSRCWWLLTGTYPYKDWLLITSLVFLATSALLETVRLFHLAWLTHRFKGENVDKGLLTWKKLRTGRKAIIRVAGRILGWIWPTLLVFVGIPLAVDLLQTDPKNVQRSLIVQFVSDQLKGHGLAHWLTVDTIALFIILSIVVYILARNQSKGANIASVKEWEHVHTSLEAVSKELQQLQQSQAEQFVKALTKDIVEPLEKQLEAEKRARQWLEDEVRQLKQQINAASATIETDASLDQEIIQDGSSFENAVVE